MGRAPIIKNGMRSVQKGEAPIEKNVLVSDEQGNTYEPTYFRRAKGLVKHGRARWMGENHICLSCPPNHLENAEDDMNETQITYIQEQIEFLKGELNRKNDLNCDSEFQPEAAAKIEEGRNQLRDKILSLMDRLADPQGEERREQEKHYYRTLLERISSDGAALQAAKDVAMECDDDDTRREIISEVAKEYENNKYAIAKKVLEVLDKLS